MDCLESDHGVHFVDQRAIMLMAAVGYKIKILDSRHFLVRCV